MDIKNLIKESVKNYSSEMKNLGFLPENRYNRDIFPATGQYDWLSGQILYCLVRNMKPKKILEISTSCGYATLFMAMALKENKNGIVETFELDEDIAKIADNNFKRYNVSQFIKLTAGDARITSMNSAKDYDIYFLDSLHTKNFAEWFIKNHVFPSVKINSLFHMHDIMPYHAKVRCWNAPPIERSPLDPSVSFKQKIANIAMKILIKKDASATDELIPIRINAPEPGKLPTYDGNRTTEAVFGNDLVKFMENGEYVFVHDLIKEYPELNPRKYNSKVMARKDAEGNLSEWNESLWCFSKAVKKAYSKLI
jgi:hypothetical protein